MDAREFKSYSSMRTGLLARIREGILLARWKNRNLPEKVRTLIERVREIEADVKSISNLSFHNMRVLEIGPGQRFRQMSYFSRTNDVLGIDLDELVQGFSPSGYLRMLRANGPMRVAKTLGRKMMGLDAAFWSEMDRQLGSRGPRRFNVQRMDATQMTFPEGAFDFVYSYATFEHIPEPEKVIREITRILRPGGAAHITLHLYTSDSGCHDPRIFSGRRDELPYWSHLRPAYAGRVTPNSYLNKVRMAEWDQIFNDIWPGMWTKHQQYGAARLRPELDKIRAAGELEGYSDDELLTVDYVAYWAKPGSSHASDTLSHHSSYTDSNRVGACAGVDC